MAQALDIRFAREADAALVSSVSGGVRAQPAESPAPVEREVALPELAGVRLSGFFIGSANYNSRIQMVPEFAGGAPVSSEPTQVDFRFAFLLVLGGVVGAYVGARLAAHVPDVWLGRVIAVVLAVVGLKEIVSP